MDFTEGLNDMRDGFASARVESNAFQEKFDENTRRMDQEWKASREQFEKHKARVHTVVKVATISAAAVTVMTVVGTIALAVCIRK